ncbi:unnamed protein product [Prorocentrum cordatum]|uniref:Calcineurin-like phosphoesterase domain-containing protein n=1 Tax=Prorocentrum cordatum TaxID=2364126 RepID=A0ABN9WC18_9DINO|nr:unnamed protein product [Polarella glacialis]
MLRALRLAGVVGTDGKWAAGSDTLVQMGDVVDRGPNSTACYHLLHRLADEASESGGAVVLLLGNHEVMNMQGDLRYVSKAELRQHGGPTAWTSMFSAGSKGSLGHTVASLHVASALRRRTLFVHGGLHPFWIHNASYAGPEALNAAVRRLLLEERRSPLLRYAAVDGRRVPGPLWDRDYQRQPEAEYCARLAESLGAWGARRAVVGHTPTPRGRPRTRCGGRLILADTGLSRWVKGSVGVTELYAERGAPDGDVFFARALFEDAAEVLLCAGPCERT